MHKHSDSAPCRLLELFKAGVFILLAAGFNLSALADGTPVSTHFSYSAPNASTVGLAGEFNSWQPAPMTKGADGTWTTDVPIAPGEYGYKFLVDGNDWELDPNNAARKTVDGIENSSLTVTGTMAAPAAPAPAPSAAAATGTATPAPASADAVLFTYSNPTASSVFLAGQFNSWDTSATPMQKDNTGTWTARLPLASGNYQYKLYVDGAWMLDPGNPQQADDGTGNQNSLKVVGNTPAPAGSPTTSATSAPMTESAAAATPAPAEDPMTLGGTPIQPKQLIQLDLPLPADTWRKTFLTLPVAQGEPPMPSDMRLKPTGVHVAISFPQNFRPEKRWPLLIVCGAGGASSSDHLGSFYEVASDEGWVSMATDAQVDHSTDSNLIRWAGLSSALDFLHTKWPASKNWPVAVAGYDGGGKKSGYMAAMLAREDFNLIGIWMGGVDYDTPSQGMHAYNPPHVRYLHTPVFLSSGKRDKGTTPEKMRVVFRSLEASGFLRAKLGTFAGGHEIDPDQIKQGLDWFVETLNAHPTLEE